VVGDAAESVGEPCLRINAVQHGGFDQRTGDCGGFAPPSDPMKRSFFLPYLTVRTNEPEGPSWVMCRPSRPLCAMSGKQR